MKFANELREGLFLKRYKRFFADVKIGDDVIVAHVPNTGSLKGCVEKERPCLVSVHNDPKRKLQHTLQMIQTETTWVGVNTSLPSLLVREVWESKLLPHWAEFDGIQAEVKISDESRIDYVLWNSRKSFGAKEKLALKHCQQSEHPLHFVEIKNVTLNHGKEAIFPDCVSTRAQKHVRELMTLVEAGHSGEFVFTVQREDCDVFRAAHELDPTYAKLLSEAYKKGVRITPLVCRLSAQGVDIHPTPLPFQA